MIPSDDPLAISSGHNGQVEPSRKREGYLPENGKVLADLLPLLEAEFEGLAFGEVVLRVQVRSGLPHRAEVSRSRSIILETHQPGAELPQNAGVCSNLSTPMRQGMR
jgi:hypothetical protein